MTIIANVRKVGSIGIFYDKEFEVENEAQINEAHITALARREAADMANEAQNWKDEWFKKFGKEYELDHFVDGIQCFYVE